MGEFVSNNYSAGPSVTIKQNDKLEIPDSERRLPNGEKVTFSLGGSKKKSNKKTSRHKDDSKTKSNMNDTASHSNGKAVTNTKQLKKSNDQRQVKLKGGPEDSKVKNGVEDVKAKKLASKNLDDKYAGSSFHSSPAALNLPKPKFQGSVNSPKFQQEVRASPAPQVAMRPVNEFGIPPNFGAPMVPPPYPMGDFHQPSFPQQGYPPALNYSMHAGYPVVGQPLPYPPNSGYAPMRQPPQPMSPAAFGRAQLDPIARDGQKISFNELLGSSE